MQVKVRKQPPKERIKNFNEVSLGLTKEDALVEAQRCLGCKNKPCTNACPVSVDIPEFIKKIKEEDFKGALDIILEKNSLCAICGRVCPQEEQCQGACTLLKKKEPILIGYLERFVADNFATYQIPDIKSNGKRVAVVGSGPAGLTAAASLAKMGFEVCIFEALHKPGGVLTYGIPEFRLPKSIVEKEIEYIRKLGVEIKLNTPVGLVFPLKELFEMGFNALFLGLGAGLPNFLNIEGENLNGVYSANEFLTRINLMRSYGFPYYDTPIDDVERVVVVGGGNVAMDCARAALRLGAKRVLVLYRRTENEMPARDEEIMHAKEEGVEFEFLTLPIRLLGDNNFHLKAIECIKMRLGEPDESGRRRPIPIENSNFLIEADTIIIAIGNRPNPILLKTTKEIEVTPKGTIKVDEYMRTSMKGVYAGGDIVTGAATVISAMGQAKLAAYTIYNDLILNSPHGPGEVCTRLGGNTF